MHTLVLFLFALIFYILLDCLFTPVPAGRCSCIYYTAAASRGEWNPKRDSTDVPVSSVRKAKKHKTMKFFARWGKTGKGWFYGLKLHITADLKGRLLALKLTPGNAGDRKVFCSLNKELDGFFIVDAGYISKELEKTFDNDARIILAIPRANMKKILTDWQYAMIQTRMRIELNFRNLKLFYGLITGMPRSDNGYFANYLYSILAYLVV